MSDQNPLLQPFDYAPFSKIDPTHFQPAILQSIEDARAEISAITENDQAPTFSNTIEALEYAGMQLGRVTSIFFNLNSAETNEQIQALAQEISPALTDFNNDIVLNQQLFERIEEVYKQKDKLQLSKEQDMLLTQHYKRFTRNGAKLSEEEKSRLRSLDKRLASLSLKFGENVLAETNNYEMHLTDEEDLKGLPEGIRSAAASLAKSKGKDGWIFNLHFPSYLPFMKYAENRELRKELALANGRKGFQGNQYDNQDIVLEIVKLRHERAQLLGYSTYAHFVLEERMAQSPESVQEFLNDLLRKAKPAAEKEFAELEAFAKELGGIDQLQIWDGAFYSEKLKQRKFALDDELLKPYFELTQVIRGAFEVANRLYGLEFQEVDHIDTYHPEVKTYKVTENNGKEVALFYADFHPREGKRGGAWMTVYKPQYRKEGKEERPHISIVCNFTRATQDQPSLLTFNEVTTLFHEFGHALHGMLAETTYPSLSGTNVFWDFVELPSQVMENWCYEKEALELFARHYQTGEVIPMDLVERIKESANFHEGMATVRQLSFGMLDMSWHFTDPADINDVKAHEEAAFALTRLYPSVKENCMSTAFSHIFQGGYAAGYYSYKWAEVLDADTFEYFRENGIFDSETAAKFRENVLSKGGTEHPLELYKRFRGQEPDPDALMRRAGLIKESN